MCAYLIKLISLTCISAFHVSKNTDKRLPSPEAVFIEEENQEKDSKPPVFILSGMTQPVSCRVVFFNYATILLKLALNTNQSINLP